MKKIILFSILLIFTISFNSIAQNYKVRQVATIMGMKVESTISVKGARKRTEGMGMMGIGMNQVIIEQCDMKRTIKLNDKKKVYFIEPFEDLTKEEVIKQEKPTSSSTKGDAGSSPKQKKSSGGTITVWNVIESAGPDKKMFGLNAKHLIATQKIIPSSDACSMTDSLVVKTEGWYVELPQFICPVRFDIKKIPNFQQVQGECNDKIVLKNKGSGKIDFPLMQTTTILSGQPQDKNNNFQVGIETLDLSTELLDDKLFDIPAGYKEVKDESELMDKINPAEMLKQMKNMGAQQEAQSMGVSAMPAEEKKSNVIRVGVILPKADQQLDATTLQNKIINLFKTARLDAVAIIDEGEARKMKCDYILKTEYSKIAAGNKLGGFIKAIKNADPNALSSYTVEGTLTLLNVNGSVQSQQKMEGKFDGKITDAASQAVEQNLFKVTKNIKK
jgi:hypothetical protein